MKRSQVPRFGPTFCHKRSRRIWETSGMLLGPQTAKKINKSVSSYSTKDDEMFVRPRCFMGRASEALSQHSPVGVKVRPTQPVRPAHRPQHAPMLSTPVAAGVVETSVDEEADLAPHHPVRILWKDKTLEQKVITPNAFPRVAVDRVVGPLRPPPDWRMEKVVLASWLRDHALDPTGLVHQRI